MRVLTMSVLFAALLPLAPAFAQADRSTPSFNPRRVVAPMPAITDAPFIAADQVTDQVVDNELVLGVVVGGAARAYSINMLTGPRREIINDTLGGQGIAATW
jgi:hypothetical protein